MFIFRTFFAELRHSVSPDHSVWFCWWWAGDAVLQQGMGTQKVHVCTEVCGGSLTLTSPAHLFTKQPGHKLGHPSHLITQPTHLFCPPAQPAASARSSMGCNTPELTNTDSAQGEVLQGLLIICLGQTCKEKAVSKYVQKHE